MKTVIRLFCLCLVMLCSCVNSSNPKIGLCFTGQGVDISGVANDFIKRVAPVAEEYEKIKEQTGLTDDDILEGSKESLFCKGKVQQALATVQCLILKGINCLYPNLHFDCVIGQSLGNYTALFAAGAISLEDLLKFLQLRDELSTDIARNAQQSYKMVVVQGIDFNILEKYVNTKTTFITSKNTKSCFTVAGVDKAVSLLEDKLKSDMPDIKLIELKVAAPFHTNFMAPLVDELWKNFPTRKNLLIPIISDATGLIYYSSDGFDKSWLKKQLTNPMLWSGANGMFERIEEQKLTHIIVVGDGQGSADMLNENIPNISAYAVKDIGQLNKVVEEIEAFRKSGL